jgi:hypothetical protein
VCTLARLELAELPSVSPINAGVWHAGECSVVYCCAWCRGGHVITYCCAIQCLPHNLAVHGVERGEGKTSLTTLAQSRFTSSRMGRLRHSMKIPVRCHMFMWWFSFCVECAVRD